MAGFLGEERDRKVSFQLRLSVCTIFASLSKWILFLLAVVENKDST